MTAFEYKGVKITLKPANGLNRQWLNRLRNLYPGYFELPRDEQNNIEEMLNLLYLVEKVDGDLGFPVPVNGNCTPETVKAFTEGIFHAHEDLYLVWLIALNKHRKEIQSDPDLLPDDELTDDQKKVLASKKSA